MKRLIKTLGILCVMLALVISGCGVKEEDTPPDTEKTVIVTAIEDSVQIKDSQVASYDYTSLFSITVDGADVEVRSSYVDASSVSETPGTYVVTCSYEGQSDSVDVIVLETEYELSLSVEEVTVKLSEAANYNYKGLFTAKEDGAAVEITEDMVETDLRAEIGDYAYTVSYHGLRETLTVHVVSEHTVEVYLSYTQPEIPVNELASFDVTSLFSLYVDGIAVRVTQDMVDGSGLAGANVGDAVKVTFNYAEGGLEAHAEVTVSVVEAAELVITARNVVTYPNAATIDLTSLFTITRGGEEIPVSIDMIEGTIDYSVQGDNEIVLTYEGKTAVATVTVQLGVIIDYAVSDTVTVRRGTDIRTYPFANDFIIVINGARYKRIPDSCFDLSEVNFEEEGTYKVTLTISYNDQPSSGFPPTFNPVDVTMEITYVVVPVSYTLTVKEELVTLDEGTTSYDPTKNLVLSINGINQSFTSNKAWADSITTYAETLTEIDFKSPEVQEVRLAVYVYGVDEQPVIVTFSVQVKTDIVVTTTERIVFTGETLYTRDLFTVTEGGAEVSITYDMLSGKVDTFTPGVYTVTLNYKGLEVTSRVVVYSREFIGTYRTGLTTIPEEEEDYDDGEYGDWGDSGWGEYYALSDGIMTIAAGVPLGNLFIEADGSMRFNGLSVYSVTGVDETTMLLKTGSDGKGREYTLHYYDGIVVLEVENNVHLAYSDYARPLMYFQTDKWEIIESVSVNYGNSHILADSTISGYYSLDMTNIRSLADGTELWYGLYIKVLERISANTYYDVQWGEVVFENGYTRAVGAVNTGLFNGETYEFTMQSLSLGKINRETVTHPYVGMSFDGEIDGKVAKLNVTASNWYELFVENELVLRVGTFELQNMRRGGELDGNRVFLYDDNSSDYGAYSYMFAMDTENLTFEVLERDVYYGRYVSGSMRIYLDGYGSGYFYADSTSTDITYAVRNGELQINFHTNNPSYTYGKEASLYVAPLLNVLTVKSSKDDLLAGAEFENEIISDGAIVRVATTMIESGSNSRAVLLRGITIFTANGEMSETEKSAAVDTSTVNFSKAGFYQFTITVSVGGKSVQSRYAVQVMGSQYAGNPVIGTYGAGVLGGSISGFILDAYGRAFITYAGVAFSGTVTIYDDNTFSIKAYDENGNFVSGKGSMLMPGLLEVTFEGAFRASDYFTTGTSAVAATSGAVLRRFTANGESVYILSQSLTTVGTVVTVTETSESGIYAIEDAAGIVRYAHITWGNTTSGLTFVEAPEPTKVG